MIDRRHRDVASGGEREAWHDREAMLASLDKLARLEAAGARIFFGHNGDLEKRTQSANGHYLGPVANLCGTGHDRIRVVRTGIRAQMGPNRF
jgi:hypothetical protein